MNRVDNRKYDELRDIKITRNYLKHPQGSVLMEMGDTKLICTAMIENRVPHFLRGKGKGWVTGEYSMLPGSTQNRKIRNAARGKIDGRTQEIQRLIGRSLRGVVDLEKLGERTLWVDCDVIQADGGTRTAAITGAFVAVVEALHWLYNEGGIEEIPLKSFMSAISVGIVEDIPMLDLAYTEDYKAQVDMNVVMTDENEFIEIQGTGEGSSYSKEQLDDLLELAEKGNRKLIEKQKEALEDIMEIIEKSMNLEGEKDE